MRATMKTRAVLIGVLGIVALAGTASASTQVHEEGPLRLTVYAPDWIWQGQNINVLVVVEHDGDGRADLNVALHLPKGLEDHFAYDGEDSQTISAGLEERQRIAFANIAALAGHPRQTYQFELVATDPGTSSGVAFRIPFNLLTIRGPMVSEGTWAAVLPAGLAAVWCLVIAMYLARHAAPGAWKTSSEPLFSADPPRAS
ncbi:MAG: hypothetical protein QGG73_05045 [Candidatus Hydrogenedentes bacterium]|nr:hypothetical protein [Candidatus Hydrogenedentota bacterium]